MQAPDPLAGLSAEDRARVQASDENAQKVLQARRDAARALLAPPGPAQAVRDAWEPVRAAQREAKGRRG